MSIRKVVYPLRASDPGCTEYELLDYGGHHLSLRLGGQQVAAFNPTKQHVKVPSWAQDGMAVHGWVEREANWMKWTAAVRLYYRVDIPNTLGPD